MGVYKIRPRIPEMGILVFRGYFSDIFGVFSEGPESRARGAFFVELPGPAVSGLLNRPRPS